MKKIFYIVTLSMGVFLTGCQSPTQKIDNAQAKVDNAKENLKDVQNKVEIDSLAKVEGWRIFKSETVMKIKENDVLIANLKEAMKKSVKKTDGTYVAQIEKLEKKNRELANKIEAYDKSLSDWESTKREFNHDMEELGKALKDLTVNNKK